MVKEFVRFVFEQKGADKVVADPETRNSRAIRCYEKCGFRKVKEMDGGKKWLMEIAGSEYNRREETY